MCWTPRRQEPSSRNTKCIRMRQLTFKVIGIITIFRLSLIYNVSAFRQESGMSFTRHPQPLAAPLGDEVDFECSLNLEADKFAWRHRPLNSKHWGPLINLPNSGGKTSKFVVTFDDESKAGTSGLASEPGRLSLAKIDKFTDKSDVEIRVPVGNTVPITCPVPYSSPEAIVQFYKNDILLKNINLTGDKTIIIENAQVSDSGNYHCTADNYIVTQTYRSNYQTKLQVYIEKNNISPFWTKQPQTEYKALKNSNISLECFGAGYPIPKLSWSRFAGSLPLYSQYKSSGLSIVNVQPSDRGEYQCVWSNDNDKIKTSIILKVVEPPRVIKGPRASTFSEDGYLELFCNVTGVPEPTIEWLINGETLEPSSSVEIRGSKLTVDPVEKKHAGIVQCVASNEYGSYSGYNLLKVNPKQHISGGDMNLHQGSHGTSGNVHKHTKGGGRRKNEKTNRKGTELVPPNPPEVTRLSDVSVMVRWSVPEKTGLPIQFFKVQYRELGPKKNGKQSSKWNTANMEIPNHIRSFEVTDLQPDHTYRFRIAAVYSNNDNKPSENSERFHLTRMAGFETNKMPIPLLTNTEALGPDRVLLIWQNPDKTVDIDGFYVYHRASTSAGDYIKTTVEGKNSTNITISHLQSDTIYEFKIQSFSVDAASEFSKIVRQKTLKAITEPPPIQQILPGVGSQSTRNSHNGTLYAIIGGTLGSITLLGALSAIVVIYKKSRIKQNRESSQNEGKSIANGIVMNGSVTDSKINITSNPLAVLDNSDNTIQPKNGQQPSMEMTSFTNGQVNNNNIDNNTNNGNDGSLASTARFNGSKADTTQEIL
ncbi:interference hedgehog-like isoform X2 [Microplitis mediator]|uniref:interference hedgehog-like isoform X2 n=1 Tax=Microplitis mediator TaxID=375433 RepID=UPI002553F96A|nr:interference hedgehog-like isoform X2 [Microplitis mediator]